ncbi:MAG: peptidase M23 [Flavobacteriaceae bacterium]|nr:peptidase M23 [Flavobacteriaceae bacterium]|tara:strand:+ start:6473 stop:7663 length:1191 start_codon:yes stop_codon:yes gene_type:complete
MNLSRIILLVIVLISSSISSQNKQDLENQKKQIQYDIKKIELKLATNSKQKKQIVSNAEDINYKIKLQQNLINNINSQLNLILREIDRNENRLSDLKERELTLKEELSKMLLSAYKKKSNLNKLMFIFSSTSFQQAYKRIQYFKQYANFQNKTLSKIKINSNEIKNVIIVLDSQKTNKKLLIDENEEINRDLSMEYTGLNNLIAEVNKNQKRYSSEIKQKQKLTREIDKKIQRLIKEALAKAKKKNGRFELTEEAKLISKNFNSNKGKLPSPVIRGNVVLGFGKQPHPIVKTTTIQSNGVRIRTSSDIEARTIFNGEVYSIIKSKNNTHTILIQHGNFFTVYKNLSNIYVKKGDKLKTKDSIGRIATDPLNGQTILSFSIFNNGVPQNPRLWIYKM